MSTVSRRAFLATSAALALVHQSGAASAAACVTAPLPGFLPNRLTVDCASKRNFQLFRQNTEYLGLSGAVSMTFVRGSIGSYQAGNLFLFPWLKPKGAALGAGRVWNAVVPTSLTAFNTAGPIPGSTLPQDEYFCRVLLQAPPDYFIGFAADAPFSKADAQQPWFTNIDKLADGKGLGVDWTSANLNAPWFGGSRAIPGTEACYGAAWRKLIIDGLAQASSAAC